MNAACTLSGLPAGYESRPLSLDDVPSVYELEAAGEAFDDGVAEADLSDMEADWSRPDFHPASMSVGVFSSGKLVAYAQVFLGRVEAMVHPQHRGKGIGSALVHWTWDVARAAGRTSVGQTVSTNEREAEALFRAHDYEPTHTSWLLRVELGPDRPAAPTLPEGYRFRPYRFGADDREVFALVDTAFDEWRGTTGESMGFENWVVWALHGVNPDLIVLVERGGRVVGAALGRDYGPGTEGWIDQLAVDKTHRGLGLGRALLEESFRRCWELGRRQCGISTDSRTGALALYEHVGMSVRRSYRRWTKRGLEPGL